MVCLILIVFVAKSIIVSRVSSSISRISQRRLLLSQVGRILSKFRGKVSLRHLVSGSVGRLAKRQVLRLLKRSSLARTDLGRGLVQG
jgi:hypothetical protein